VILAIVLWRRYSKESILPQISFKTNPIREIILALFIVSMIISFYSGYLNNSSLILLLIIVIAVYAHLIYRSLEKCIIYSNESYINMICREDFKRKTEGQISSEIQKMWEDQIEPKMKAVENTHNKLLELLKKPLYLLPAHRYHQVD
jgi:hypothetical protein